MQGTPTSRKSGSNAPHRPSILATPRGRRQFQAVVPAHSASKTRVNALMLGTHISETVVMGPRFRGDDSIRAVGMIVLFTDFGLQGPYTGQMKAVLQQMAPGISIIDLFADAPAPA